MGIIDLRRDTITLPTEEMREKAFQAPLGDSVYGEDTKQRELEEYGAWKMGKDEAIFVPSGTMGNLVALLSHTGRGEEIILEENAHVRLSETGGAACVAGLMMKTVAGRDGVPEPEDVERSMRPDNIHYPKTSLICLESTHYRYGGIVPPLEKLEKIRRIAESFQIPVHLDGARIFNASVYLGTDVKEITQFADTVMVSLSKGLGAPVGSVLCGPREFMIKARRYRKMLGGGMRQTGWLCACGLVALSDENIRRLEEDHQNARLLAKGITGQKDVSVDLERVQTNFVLAHFESPRFTSSEFLNGLRDKGVYATAAGERTVRFVTSKQVSHEDILCAIDAVEEVLSGQA
jgi:threonine aldolase